jgi:soluble lytic murein transglycosylase
MKRLSVLLLLATALPAAPALAADSAPATAARRAPPSQLTQAQREGYRAVFASLKASDWAAVEARLAVMGDGPLHNAARAELYLAPGSPKVALEPLLTLLARAPELPQAPQLARLARTRGAESLPELPETRNLAGLSGQPRRKRPDGFKGDPEASALDARIQPLIVDDRPAEAEALLSEKEGVISSDARTELQQRIAWSYYLTGNDAAARRLAAKARAGTGEWVIQADWTGGLAAWRMRDCNAASEAFAAVAMKSTDVELSAAGHYWGARAEMICGRPERVQARLRGAARFGETFYGLLAASALGIHTPASASPLHDYHDSEWRGIAHRANVKAAIAYAELGERGRADELIRHEARLGSAQDHAALIHLAAELDLAGTQFWLAHNAPRGSTVNLAARYPAPDWKPLRGWRVDQSLAYAHALQESSFRTQVVSPAGAVGLMQVRPGTASDMARYHGDRFTREQLTEPPYNLEYGQSYLEYLRGNAGTGGLLPKVIAAYNAGPSPIAEWNTRYIDGGDPLLYIESIPYWETRGYVPIVLRNYWIYEQQAGRTASASRSALAQGLWPRFPGLPGASAVRIQPSNTSTVRATE